MLCIYSVCSPVVCDMCCSDVCTLCVMSLYCRHLQQPIHGPGLEEDKTEGEGGG